MFAVIYQSYLKSGCEEKFQQNWKTIAAYFVKERGAISSTLHQGENGQWIAYSKWPSKDKRDASWPGEGKEVCSSLPLAIQKAIHEMKGCLDRTREFSELCMSVSIEVK